MKRTLARSALAAALFSASLGALAQQDFASSFLKGFSDGCRHPAEFMQMTQNLCTWKSSNKNALPECSVKSLQTPAAITPLISPTYNVKKDPAKTPDLLATKTQGALRIDTFEQHQTISFQLEPKKVYFGPLAVSKMSLVLGRGNGINISVLEFSDALSVTQAQALLTKSNIKITSDTSGPDPLTPELWFDKRNKKLLLMCDLST